VNATPFSNVRRRARRHYGGYTLPELLISLLVMALMMRFAVPVLSGIISLSGTEIVASVAATEARAVQSTIPALLQGSQPRAWCSDPPLSASANPQESPQTGQGELTTRVNQCPNPVLAPIPVPPPAQVANPYRPGGQIASDPYAWVEDEEGTLPTPSACFPSGENFLPGAGGLLFASASCLGFFTYDHERSSFQAQAAPTAAPLLAWLYIDNNPTGCAAQDTGYSPPGPAGASSLAPCLLLALITPTGGYTDVSYPANAFNGSTCNPQAGCQTYFIGSGAGYYKNGQSTGQLTFTYWAGGNQLALNPCPYGPAPMAFAAAQYRCVAQASPACYSGTSCANPLQNTPMAITEVQLTGRFSYASLRSHSTVRLNELMPVPGNTTGAVGTQCSISAPGGTACGDLNQVS
jgi:type II secretory pathway pseudopilin PulG